MLVTILFSVVGAAFIGAVAAAAALRSSALRLGPVAAAVAATACVVAAIPVAVVGTNIARADAVTYSEFWNGFETDAVAKRVPCSEDGACTHTYQCHPYEVYESYTDTETYTTVGADGKPKTQTRTVTKWRWVTRYHSCPYATAETTYVVRTTLGDYTIASSWFDENPVPFEDRSVPTSVGRGIPAQWAAARARLDAGRPGGVTAVRDYDNYILASNETILRAHSDDVYRYQAEGLLPSLASDVHDSYVADKAYVVGEPAGIDAGEWRDAVMNFNAALGTDLRGDLHLVVVDTADVGDPDAYTGAIEAYWTSTAMGRHALSKNGIVVVAGVEHGTIDWARAFTGMPVGNEHMVQDIVAGLPGVSVTSPDPLLGRPTATLADGTVASVEPGDGALAAIVWGPNRFERVCMVCKGADDHGVGYEYLAAAIEPSTGAKATMVAVAMAIAAVVWAAAVATSTVVAGPTAPDRPRPATRRAGPRLRRWT